MHCLKIRALIDTFVLSEVGFGTEVLVEIARARQLALRLPIGIGEGSGQSKIGDNLAQPAWLENYTGGLT